MSYQSNLESPPPKKGLVGLPVLSEKELKAHELSTIARVDYAPVDQLTTDDEQTLARIKNAKPVTEPQINPIAASETPKEKKHKSSRTSNTSGSAPSSPEDGQKRHHRRKSSGSRSSSGNDKERGNKNKERRKSKKTDSAEEIKKQSSDEVERERKKEKKAKNEEAEYLVPNDDTLSVSSEEQSLPNSNSISKKKSTEDEVN